MFELLKYSGLHNTDIDLSKNKLKTIDEDVFKPLLVDSAVNVMMFDSKILIFLYPYSFLNCVRPTPNWASPDCLNMFLSFGCCRFDVE